MLRSMRSIGRDRVAVEYSARSNEILTGKWHTATEVLEAYEKPERGFGYSGIPVV